MPRTTSEGVVVALFVALAGMSAADVVHPNRPGLLVLVFVPFLAALLLRPRATATLSVACVVLALTLPGSLNEAGAVRFVRVAAIAGISVMAVIAAVWRQRVMAIRVDLTAQRTRLERDRQEALEVNDAILQDVFTARMWMQLGREAEATNAITRALESTRGLVGSLLGEQRSPEPEELRRESPSQGSAATS